MIKPTPNPPVRLFTVADGISTEDLLVNLSETLASANALSCDLAFDLEGPKREELLGVAQLIELAQLLADRVLNVSGQVTRLDDGNTPRTWYVWRCACCAARGKPAACYTAIAGKPAPTIDRISELERGLCGSWLACDESNAVSLNIPPQCRSELAREKPENTAGRQATRVIVTSFSSASDTWSAPGTRSPVPGCP